MPDTLLLTAFGRRLAQARPSDTARFQNSLTGTALLAVCLIALNYATAFLSARVPRARKWIEGEPVVLARDGKVFRHVLRRELVSHDDFSEALRMNNIDDIGDVRLALLETNGRITVMARQRD